MKIKQTNWINVKDKLPQYGKGNFLAYWNTQNIMFICFVDVHSNYIISGSSRDTCGFGNYPKFSHWMPVPKPPTKIT